MAIAVVAKATPAAVFAMVELFFTAVITLEVHVGGTNPSSESFLWDAA